MVGFHMTVHNFSVGVPVGMWTKSEPDQTLHEADMNKEFVSYDNVSAGALLLADVRNMRHRITMGTVSGANHRVSCIRKRGMSATTTVSHDAAVFVQIASGHVDNKCGRRQVRNTSLPPHDVLTSRFSFCSVLPVQRVVMCLTTVNHTRNHHDSEGTLPCMLAWLKPFAYHCDHIE